MQMHQERLTHNLRFRKVDEELEMHRRLTQKKVQTVDFQRYYRHDKINKYLDSLAKENIEGVKIDVKNVGKSYERLTDPSFDDFER